MNDLGTRIQALIAAQGPLAVAQYMTIALHDPNGGYYATHDPFGAPGESGGDFVTAPQLSQIFGELIGLWCVQAWIDQGKSPRPRLVELGPGRGTLMADALRASAKVPEFLRNLDVALVESSPLLRGIQQKMLEQSAARWVTHFDEALTDRPLFLIANEFFDALPIRQYVKTPRGWCERMVTAKDGRLGFALAPVPAPGVPEGAQASAPEGAVHETSPAGLALMAEIAAAIARHGGAALIVDYGYEAGAGFGETFQAVRRHRFADVLGEPGENDLTAHVDFTALAAAARRAGAAAFGPVLQGEFLARLGIAERAGQLARANPADAGAIAASVRRLTEAGGMGRLFKALAILPANAPPPPGFL